MARPSTRGGGCGGGTPSQSRFEPCRCIRWEAMAKALGLNKGTNGSPSGQVQRGKVRMPLRYQRPVSRALMSSFMIGLNRNLVTKNSQTGEKYSSGLRQNEPDLIHANDRCRLAANCPRQVSTTRTTKATHRGCSGCSGCQERTIKRSDAAYLGRVIRQSMLGGRATAGCRMEPSDR